MINLALLLVALAASLFCGLLCARANARSRSGLPIATIAISCLTAAAFAAQLRFPALLVLFERDAGRIAAGQAWRLVTALLFQDGGAAGAIFNLAFLVALGPLAERLWGPAKWLLLYFGGGIAAGLVALAWQPVGAGNSIAILALAGALCTSAVRVEGTARMAAAIALLCGAALAALRDIHGPALLLGAFAGAAMAVLSKVRARVKEHDRNDGVDLTDYAIIFGAAVRPDARPSPTLQHRIDGALAWARDHPGTIFMPTRGVGRHGPAEGQVVRRSLIDAGIDPGRIVAEIQGRDTLESVRLCDALLRKRGDCRQVICCTSTYHQPRCALLLRLLGYRVVLPPMPNGRGHLPRILYARFVAKELVATPYDVALLLARSCLRGGGRQT